MPKRVQQLLGYETHGGIGVVDVGCPSALLEATDSDAPTERSTQDARRTSMTEVVGKGAVVTGAGSGIGMGLAKEWARQGASVAVADIMLNACASRRRDQCRWRQHSGDPLRRLRASSWTAASPAYFYGQLAPQ